MERGLEDMSSILKVEDLVKVLWRRRESGESRGSYKFTDRERQVLQLS